ncbi:hypothetical protein BC936DRAFT_144410 [Jimgerdemannia flammicorona]|uniref:Anaphase-promoting complex subunit 4-like WD40 domain-containing protein n=1 Tax=Jimgerdemannia flammicorona TaxID=994334 RepID=A0A433DM90_9FUNG|nr:hypothetical protein BC936DRAFT_144410 [Jimgerdemannia flammicorona]
MIRDCFYSFSSPRPRVATLSRLSLTLSPTFPRQMIDFSDLYKKESGALCLFSPNGAYVATAVQQRLVVRDAQTLQVVGLYDCADAIQHIAWSNDSEYVLSASFKEACVEIWSIGDPDWTAKIEEGFSGLSAVTWAPDARSVLSFAEFQLRVTIWNLVTKETSYIQYPKFFDKGYDFRSDNRYFALAERRESKDYIGIYDCHDWSLVKQFSTETIDMEGLAWSPDGKYIAVWDTPLDYKLLVYAIDGRCLVSYFAYRDNLGIKSIAWAPSGQFLAVGSFDQKVRLLNHYTWNPTAEFEHSSSLKKENLTWPKFSEQCSEPGYAVRSDACRRPLSVHVLRLHGSLTDHPSRPILDRSHRRAALHSAHGAPGGRQTESKDRRSVLRVQQRRQDAGDEERQYAQHTLDLGPLGSATRRSPGATAARARRKVEPRCARHFSFVHGQRVHLPVERDYGRRQGCRGAGCQFFRL